MATVQDVHAQVGEHRRPGVWQTCLLVLGVVPFMAGLFSLYTLLGIGLPYFGFLFLIYWAGILRQEPAHYLPSVLGGAGGIGLGWALVTLPHLPAPFGMIAAGILLAGVLFCFMRGHLPWLWNNAAMLFLIVATIPDLNVGRTVVTMLCSLTLGAGYMGAVALLVRLIAKRRMAE